MAKLDVSGRFRGEVIEHAYGLTKNGFPQAIVRAKAEERYVEAHEIAQFQMDKPGWVDWSEYGHELTGYFVLFKTKTPPFNESNANLNAEQICKALGWKGESFEELDQGCGIGKKVQFTSEENTWDGKTDQKMTWIDTPDASPSREMKRLDPNQVKQMSAGLSFRKAAPVKLTKPMPSMPPKPSGITTPTPASRSRSSAPVAVMEKPDSSVRNEELTDGGQLEVPITLTQAKAWDFVNKNKNASQDNEVQEAWIKATAKVARGRDDGDLTPEDWSSVASWALANLGVIIPF